MKKETGWIGVNLDGTLAYYDPSISYNPGYIGDPIPKMLERVKKWISEGRKVKIFTARCCVREHIPPIIEYLEKHGIGGLEITNIKDYNMIELWDDRCVQVKKNTGERISRT